MYILIIFYDSYGCSWSEFYNRCKYSVRSTKDIEKFQMKKSSPPSASKKMENCVNDLATILGKVSNKKSIVSRMVFPKKKKPKLAKGRHKSLHLKPLYFCKLFLEWWGPSNFSSAEEWVMFCHSPKNPNFLPKNSKVIAACN